MNNELSDKKILEVAKRGLLDAVQASFSSGYNNPLQAMVKDVLENHSGELKEMLSEMLLSSLHTEDFKSVVRQEFTHKVAKTLVSKLEGSVEKAVDAIRHDPTLRAKMIISIETMINNNQPNHD